MERSRVDLEMFASELLVQHKTPGAAIGFIDSGEATIATVGVRGNGRGSVEADTIFAAASLTKPVFAAGVMVLVDRGTLELDRPLTDYLAEPYLPDDERSKSITARMVLSHTTGFPNWREGSDDRAHPAHGALSLRWLPGSRWGYSGEGFSYLQHVIEKICGAPVADVLAETVLGPLGMTDSTFMWPGADESRFAVGHTESGEPRPPFHPPTAKAAAGGLFTTVPDYLRFLDHCLVHEHRMFVEQVQVDDQLSWGLGWGLEVGDEKAIWQWGNDPGYKNYVIGLPGLRVGVVVLTNGDCGAVVYRDVVRELLPGVHPSLEPDARPGWVRGWQPVG